MKLSKKEEKSLLIQKTRKEALEKYSKKTRVVKPLGGNTTGAVGAEKGK